jgi:uncharacterized RDD family membrane protein YckC
MNVSIENSLYPKGFKSAPIWRRVAAICYDFFLVLSLLMATGFVKVLLTAIAAKFKFNVVSNINQQIFFIILLLITISFFCYFWIKSRQTLGMRSWKIYICNSDYSVISCKQAVIRCLVAIPSLLFFGIGILWVLVDKKHRSWQDIASSTITCHKIKL